MPKIIFNKQTFDCKDGETVLECLDRHGVAAPSSCRSGVCQTCIMRAEEGTPPESSQKGLKSTQQQQGYFLACICKPEQDISATISGDNIHKKTTTTIIDKTPLNEQIMRLRLARPEGFEYRPGQFLNLYRDDNLIRSYSIASQSEDEFLELHIERLANGKMSNWLHDISAIGSNIEIDGSHGDCFYLNDSPEQNLLLIGTGTGLAPLWGIARDALNKKHRGDIHLFHGSRNAKKLYLVDELKALATQHSNFHYTPCVSGDKTQDGITQGRANETALTRFKELSGWRIYLCGHPEMVNSTKINSFLAGAALQDILADPFTINSRP